MRGSVKTLLMTGFGDFTPETPAGKVVFVVYALMAVPIVTSFAVQTITGLVSARARPVLMGSSVHTRNAGRNVIDIAELVGLPLTYFRLTRNTS